MGLTADLEEKWLYWLVRSYDGSELHRAPTADQITHGASEVCLVFYLLSMTIYIPTKLRNYRKNLQLYDTFNWTRTLCFRIELIELEELTILVL